MIEIMSDEFAKKLRSYFGDADLKGEQTRLAEFLDISPQAVQQWMSGKTEPGQKRYKKIAEFFNISESEFRFGTNNKTLEHEMLANTQKTIDDVETLDLLGWIELYKNSSPEEREYAKKLLSSSRSNKKAPKRKGREDS